ncbi:MAG: hypothetical protein KH242_08090 [Varibaculum cambriense]|uniref:Uncharacterized protein n=1 Tax=Varibaculum cambriense TaxID=184870 RepID=A0AAJ1BCZ2_9ACTO|nr:hypothetical protein [Varibaculum cambriense]MBS6754497.1 hypothetical protein [Varibaculum cambriense]MCG4618406.1 hypothetical protein [Varibaculum cambriense]
MSGHGSAPLHEYGVYVVNPVFGPALPVAGVSQQCSAFVRRASLAQPGAFSPGASASDAACA